MAFLLAAFFQMGLEDVFWIKEMIERSFQHSFLKCSLFMLAFFHDLGLTLSHSELKRTVTNMSYRVPVDCQRTYCSRIYVGL